MLTRLVLMFITAGSVCLAAPWNQFRGPNGEGKSEANAPSAFGEDKNVKWKTPMPGKAWSSPVVWGDQVWFTNAEKDGKKLWAVCLDLETGRVVHNALVFEIEKPQFCIEKNSYASPTPVIEAGRVYVTFGSHGTACLDTKTARTLWHRQDLACDHFRGAASSPILHGDLFILLFDGADQQYVVALDKKDGKTKWLHRRAFDFRTDNGDAKKGYGTPSIITHQGRAQLICPAAVATEALDPATGELLWTVRTGGMNASALPLYGHGLVFVSNGMGRLSAIRPEGTGDISVKGIVWDANKNIPRKPSYILLGDLLFMMDDSGIASCMDAKTGAVVWNERIGGAYSASPILAKDRIYWFSEEGDVPVIAAAREFKLVAKNKLPDGFMATPAVAGDALILRTKSAVYRVQ